MLKCKSENSDDPEYVIATANWEQPTRSSLLVTLYKVNQFHSKCTYCQFVDYLKSACIECPYKHLLPQASLHNQL